MKKLILIEELQVGNLFFSAYVVEDEKQLPAFAIFIDRLTEPIIKFIPRPATNIVDIHIDVSYCDYIAEKKTRDKKLRQSFFKTFIKFINAAEAKARDTIFRNKKMDYIKDDVLIKKIKTLYLED